MAVGRIETGGGRAGTLDGDLREDGTATVLFIAVVACLVLVGSTFLASSFIRVDRHAAQTAADLAALAGANQLVNGTGEPCAAARSVVKSNGRVLSGCAIVGESVHTNVEYGTSLGHGHVVSVAGANTPEPSEEY